MRLLMAVLFGLLSLEVGAQVSKPTPPGPKEAAIRRLLQVTGGGRLGVQVIDTMMSSFKKGFPAVPEVFWTEFRSEIHEDDLVDMCVPIYDRHFSEEEILGIVAFYETPLGKRLLEAQPLVLQESMQAGQEWGRTLGQRVINRLKERGYTGQGTGALGGPHRTTGGR
jgi:hypothetical protein